MDENNYLVNTSNSCGSTPAWENLPSSKFDSAKSNYLPNSFSYDLEDDLVLKTRQDCSQNNKLGKQTNHKFISIFLNKILIFKNQDTLKDLCLVSSNNNQEPEIKEIETSPTKNINSPTSLSTDETFKTCSTRKRSSTISRDDSIELKKRKNATPLTKSCSLYSTPSFAMAYSNLNIRESMEMDENNLSYNYNSSYTLLDSSKTSLDTDDGLNCKEKTQFQKFPKSPTIEAQMELDSNQVALSFQKFIFSGKNSYRFVKESLSNVLSKKNQFSKFSRCIVSIFIVSFGLIFVLNSIFKDDELVENFFKILCNYVEIKNPADDIRAF